VEAGELSEGAGAPRRRVDGFADVDKAKQEPTWACVDEQGNRERQRSGQLAENECLAAA